jgi:hypothetical protein
VLAGARFRQGIGTSVTHSTSYLYLSRFPWRALLLLWPLRILLLLLRAPTLALCALA